MGGQSERQKRMKKLAEWVRWGAGGLVVAGALKFSSNTPLGWFDFGALAMAFLIAMVIVHSQRRELQFQHQQLLASMDREHARTLWIYVHASRLGIPMDTGLLAEVRKQAELWAAEGRRTTTTKAGTWNALKKRW